MSEPHSLYSSMSPQDPVDAFDQIKRLKEEFDKVSQSRKKGLFSRFKKDESAEEKPINVFLRAIGKDVGGVELHFEEKRGMLGKLWIFLKGRKAEYNFEKNLNGIKRLLQE